MTAQSASQPGKAMFVGAPPAWSLVRPKPILQAVYDFVGAPLRMAVLPDHISERLHLTSLRSERLSAVLPQLRGRVLDVGAGDNMLLKLYRARTAGTRDQVLANGSVGLDVVDWGGSCLIVPDCRHFPFEDESFDTVCFVACLNHIPERVEALKESYRVLRKGGRIIVTMIGRIVGIVGHAIWWYSEDKHRKVQKGEVMGMDPADVSRHLAEAAFGNLRRIGLVYGLNHVFIAERK